MKISDLFKLYDDDDSKLWEDALDDMSDEPKMTDEEIVQEMIDKLLSDEKLMIIFNQKMRQYKLKNIKNK